MKHAYLFTFLLALLLGRPVALRAQALTDDTRQQLDYLFAPLDKTQVPTGFLIEYGLPLAPLDPFNGTLTDSSLTNPAGFRFLYASAYSARASGSNPLPTLQTLNARVEAATATAGTAIPLLVQRIDYATVRPDAFDLNLLSYQNGQIYDVPERTKSPYLLRTLFAAAPARATAPTGDVSFMFQPDLHIQSGGGTVQALRIDFGDGRGYVAAAWNQPVTASYATAGTKRIKVRVTYASQQYTISNSTSPIQQAAPQALPSYESHFDIEVAQPAVACTTCRYAVPGSVIDIDPVPGVHSGAKVSIRYGGSHTQLIRPFIVVEGYDKHFIAPAISPENYDVSKFLEEIEIANGFNFRDALDNTGEYDLVFIDFTNGTDDLLRNAVIFEDVLDRVETLKVVNPATNQREDNVVMGMSMGGLISRYKLAEITKAGRPTHTRLLLLQDSPQRGANVPLGLQATIRQANFPLGSSTTADMIPALKQALLLLDEPATRQMLVHRATDATGGFEANSFLDGAYRGMVTFSATGAQPTYRVVAASQGSQCNQILFGSYTELFHADGRLFLSPFPLISRYSYETQVIVNALPSGGQSRRVSYMQLKRRLRLLGFIYRSTTTSVSYACPSGLLAWDGVSPAGGTEPVSGTPGGLNKPFGGSFLIFLDATLNVAAVERFSFVPTASGLDAEIINQASLFGSYSNGVAPVSRLQVAAFVAQESYQANGTTYFNQPT
ncbi:hypothetical protein [Hymenobacter sp.]|jgi:hypothetical protein|uniref:hypothetical protein n=1 Tax=Hymenobacter sp. TaxID=1898978 RepID=UPI002EDA5866